MRWRRHNPENEFLEEYRDGGIERWRWNNPDLGFLKEEHESTNGDEYDLGLKREEMVNGWVD